MQLTSEQKRKFLRLHQKMVSVTNHVDDRILEPCFFFHEFLIDLIIPEEHHEELYQILYSDDDLEKKLEYWDGIEAQ